MSRRRYRTFLLFVGPPMLVYVVFCLYPMLAGIFTSLTEWDGYSGSQRYVGLANFEKLLGDEVFQTALKNNLFLVVVPGVIILALGLYLANVLREEQRRGRSTFQFAYLFPNILAGTVVAALWSFVYNPSFGVVKKLLEGLNWTLQGVYLGKLSEVLHLSDLAGQAWLAPQHFMWALVPMLIWGGTGFYVVLFLAGMQNIPREQYEAARIDGANEWQVFRHVTWPGLAPIITAAVTFMVIGGMKIFDVIWVMTQQSVPDRNQVLGTYVYQQAFVEARMGYGTAVAMVLMIITVGVVLLAQRLSARKQ